MTHAKEKITHQYINNEELVSIRRRSNDVVFADGNGERHLCFNIIPRAGK